MMNNSIKDSYIKNAHKKNQHSIIDKTNRYSNDDNREHDNYDVISINFDWLKRFIQDKTMIFITVKY